MEKSDDAEGHRAISVLDNRSWGVESLESERLTIK